MFVIILSSVKFYRKSILLAAGIVAAGGAAVYLKSRISSPRLRGDDDDGALEKRTGNNKNAKKKGGGGGLKSLQVLTAILLSQMGKMGARDLLALVATVVCFCFMLFPKIWQMYMIIFLFFYTFTNHRFSELL